MRLGVGGGNEERKRRTLNAVVVDEQNLLDATVEYRARKNEERKNLCCGNALSVAVEGFCVDHFLFNGSRSLSLSPFASPSYILSCYQSISTRRIHTTKEESERERKFVLEPFVRLSVHLSILYCLSSVTLLLCMCAYVRVYTLCSHLLSFPFALLCICMYVHTHTRSHWWSKGCSEVNFALVYSSDIHCSFSGPM